MDSNNTGIVFMFYYPSSYSNTTNKNNKNKMIKLFNIRVLLETQNDICGFKTYPYNSKVSFDNLPVFLDDTFGIKPTHIKEFNSIHSKFIKNKKVTVFVVLLDPTQFTEIINILESNGHYFIQQTKLLFYDNYLNTSITDNIDIGIDTADKVLNYYNTKKATLDGISCIDNKNKLNIISFLDIVDTLRGIVSYDAV